MAGLSAAWRLQKRGYEDFLLLDLEHEAGGNSRGGENEISAYPWGAHYVPIPTPESLWVRELFEELGVIEGYDAKGHPRYHELYLCSDPEERLLMHGHWQEGLVPERGITQQDRAQYDAFFREMEAFKGAIGADGKPAFAIPLDSSSRDPRYLEFDRLTMAQYMDEKGWTSEPLRWYVNYCCRDDYGCRMDEVSAWAGIHYFASRVGKAANAEPNAMLTWPEGNGWIVKQLVKKVQPRIRTDALVFNVENAPEDKVIVDYFDTRAHKTIRLVAKSAILAVPRFVAARIVKDFRQQPPSHLKAFGYAPWLVANICLNELPKGPGAPLSWENVSYHGPSLGYVVATHQQATQYPPKSTVITYYWPLSDRDPVDTRKKATERSFQDWSDLISADLDRMHPGIVSTIARMDIWLWGHAMVRPVPGFIWGGDREEALKPHGRLFFAHSDMSGISIFEEAQFHGVVAADGVLATLVLAQA